MDYPVYYGVDENGNIVMSDDSSILDDTFVDLFPESASDLLGESDSFEDSVSDTVSGSDSDSDVSYNGPSASDIASELDIISYDQLIDALAAIPGYNTYPNTAAISVFDSVFVGNSNIHYICLADDTGTSMYYSSDYDISGNTITLKSPVTYLHYYSSRINNVTYYYYTVTNLSSDQSFTPTTQLVYTDLLKNYPSLPSDIRGVPGSSIFSGYRPLFTGICLIVVVGAVLKTILRRKIDD